jgi:hypothetical protein
MIYFLIIILAVFTAFAVERTVDVFIAVRRGYFSWRFGLAVVAFSWLPVAAAVTTASIN